MRERPEALLGGQFAIGEDRLQRHDASLRHSHQIVRHLPRVDPVSDEEFPDDFELVAPQQLELEFVVFEAAKPASGMFGIEPADGQRSVTANEQATAVSEVVTIEMRHEEVAPRIGTGAVAEDPVRGVDEARQGVASGPITLVAVDR